MCAKPWINPFTMTGFVEDQNMFFIWEQNLERERVKTFCCRTVLLYIGGHALDHASATA